MTIQVPEAGVGEPGHGWFALEGHHQSLIGVDGLLAQGGEVGADDGEGLGAVVAAEATGDLLL